jgi:GAF domain-containing protein
MRIIAAAFRCSCRYPACETSASGGPVFRFYAGAPVIDADGFALGSLCVIDHRPHTLDENQLRSLRALAGLASDEVRLRTADRQLR